MNIESVSYFFVCEKIGSLLWKIILNMAWIEKVWRGKSATAQTSSIVANDTVLFESLISELPSYINENLCKLFLSFYPIEENYCTHSNRKSCWTNANIIYILDFTTAECPLTTSPTQTFRSLTICRFAFHNNSFHFSFTFHQLSRPIG